MGATYRSDLDHLNELSFARFDAKLEQRLAQLEAKWDQRLGQMDTKWEQRLAHLEIRLAKDLGTLRADMVRWMFAFWTGNLLVLAGFLLAILKSR